MYLLISFQLAAYFSRALGWSFEPCSEIDYQGVCEVLQNTGCMTLTDSTWANEYSMHDNINSIRKVDGCVRLYEGFDCKGRSQAYYPGAKGLRDIRREDGASSVGPCMEYECANKNFNHGIFDCVSHDVIYLSENWGLKTIEVNDHNNPITKYQRGYGDRVEYVFAKFKTHHLYRGTKMDAANKAYAVKLGGKGDVAGMIIGPQLGGNGTLAYNVFPQNGLVAKGRYREIFEREVFAQTARDGEVWCEVNLHYDDARATRPSALIYALNPPMYTSYHHLPNPVMN